MSSKVAAKDPVLPFATFEKYVRERHAQAAAPSLDKRTFGDMQRRASKTDHTRQATPATRTSPTQLT
jgi:hypothetical protein